MSSWLISHQNTQFNTIAFVCLYENKNKSKTHLFNLLCSPALSFSALLTASLNMAMVFSAFSCSRVFSASLLLSASTFCCHFLLSSQRATPSLTTVAWKKNTLTVWLEARLFNVIAISVLYKMEDLFSWAVCLANYDDVIMFRELFLSYFIFSHMCVVVLKFHPFFEF